MFANQQNRIANFKSFECIELLFVPWQVLYKYCDKSHGSRINVLVYVFTPTFSDVCMILDMVMLTCMLIFSLYFFKVFKIFQSSHDLILFKNLVLYIWSLIYLFVLGRDRFFTAYICFKEPIFQFFIQTIK